VRATDGAPRHGAETRSSVISWISSIYLAPEPLYEEARRNIVEPASQTCRATRLRDRRLELHRETQAPRDPHHRWGLRGSVFLKPALLLNPLLDVLREEADVPPHSHVW
jgi:hypothetical protein